MRFFKVIGVILGAAFLVTSLCMSVGVMAAPLDAARSNSTADPQPAFTRFVTITVAGGAPLLPTLNSAWQQTILGFPVGTDGFTRTVFLPTDATVITASVNNGSFSIIGTSIEFRLLPGPTNFGWSYHTDQQVVRTGNEYQIDQIAASNAFYRYVGTILFPGPYQYVGSTTFAPQLVTTDTIQWDLIVPVDPETGQHRFNATSWLVDPRLNKPDLAFTAAQMTIESGLNPPIAHLTATIRNNNVVDIASIAAYLEFYDRASPSTPPDGPLDHAGGWCGSAPIPACQNFPTFSNPIPSLAPGASATVAMTYPLQSPGLRDYYFQIDTFGGVNGFNIESNEANNVYTLTRGVAIDYLASVIISGPLTGTAHSLLAFNAQVTPSLAVSRPLTYTWSPTPLSGQGTANAIYTWVTGTSQTITVTARNANQITVTDTHTISIEVPLTSAIISGPITVSQNIPHAYRINVQPITATLPIVYVWDPEPEQGQLTEVVTYTEGGLGEYLFSVYVSNPIGPVITATHRVVSVPPLAAAAITGPLSSALTASAWFTATVDPIESAPPLDYQWSPSPNNGQGTAHAQYHWTNLGMQLITITVHNDSGSVSNHYAIQVTGSNVYLPLLRK